MKLPEIDKISPELRQVVLFDRAATAKDMGSILVTDRLGKVVLDSRSLVPAEASYSGLDFFRFTSGKRTLACISTVPGWRLMDST